MKYKNNIYGFFGVLGIYILIFDSKTAISGCQEGIQICIQTVIPALFPFLVVSALACKCFLGTQIPLLRPLGRLCKLPEGAESILVLGFLGGYPVGARNIVTAVQSGSIDKEDAKRMLGFCNNAGPAFLFGMVGCLFDSRAIPWIIWIIHIAAAIIVAHILPGKSISICKLQKTTDSNFIKDIEYSIRTMANICAWVILFRILIAFLNKWLLFMLPVEISIWLSGLAELSNGVIGLQAITDEGLRFILCSGLLGFGGLCVAMQTISITSTLGSGYYFPGKILQGCLSIIFAILAQNIIFPKAEFFIVSVYWMLIPLLCIILTVFIIYSSKNNSRNLSGTYV